jgi:thiol:disulfide interchange protein DsbA
MWSTFSKVLASLVVLSALLASSPSLAVDPVEGKNYRKLENPQPVETGNKIEVIEFFSYACPHCASFEPRLGPWIKTLPADVQFRRIPALFQPGWTELARVYYTLETMGESEKLSQAVFKAIHSDGVNLKSDKVFFDWAAKQGLDRQKVADIYNSFAVNSKLNRAKSQAQAYRIEGVPGMTIDGKYFVDGSLAGNYDNWFQIADGLIAKSRQERTKKT